MIDGEPNNANNQKETADMYICGLSLSQMQKRMLG